MRCIVWLVAVGLAASASAPAAAQSLLEGGVLRPPSPGRADTAALRARRDTTIATTDTRPTIGGSIFVGSLAWYPGALVGFLFTADGECFDRACSSSSRHAMDVGTYGGGGLLAGLAVGAIARTSSRCSRSRALRAGVLGAEIGSFGTAAAAGLLGDRPIHSVTPYAAVALPVVSAATATWLTRRCIRR